MSALYASLSGELTASCVSNNMDHWSQVACRRIIDLHKQMRVFDLLASYQWMDILMISVLFS
jgi:hypothetical protein